MTSDYFEMLKGVREAYIQNWNGRRRQDPYKFGDWFRYLTPIERNVWNDIRYLGLPFYPQFPVGKYYIDFADPFEKIALEIDGKIHQEQEVALRDAEKTKFLNSKGWKVIRIPGWKTYRHKDRYAYEEQNEYGDWLSPEYETETAEAILEEIQRRMYRRETPTDSELVCSLDILEEIKKQEAQMDNQRQVNKILFSYDSIDTSIYNNQTLGTVWPQSCPHQQQKL